MRTKAAWLLVVPFFVLARPVPWTLVAGSTVAAIGLALRAWSAGTLRKEEALTTTGPYAYTRNPLYLGSLLIGTGLGLAGGHWLWPLVFYAYFALAYRRTMAQERERLSGLFGERYRAYTAEVPALVPRRTPYRGGASEDAAAFRWNRYMRNREWEALLGTVAAISALSVKLAWLG